MNESALESEVIEHLVRAWLESVQIGLNLAKKKTHMGADIL